MLDRWRFGCLLVLIATVSQCPQRTLAQEKPEAKATIQISVKSRNGVPLLAQVLIALADLADDRRFAQILARTAAPSNEETDCLANARKDPSGLVFDSANCLGVWPEAGKAVLPKVFEQKFVAKASVNAVTAFPAVRVAPFEFQLRLQSTQFPKVSVGNLEGKHGRLEPTAAFRAMLCDPNVTFIDPAKCEVKVVKRFHIYPDDLYVSQTGYRVRLTNPMLPEHARALRSEFLRLLDVPKSTPNDAVTIAILKETSTHSEQLAPRDEVKPAESNADIEKLWKSLGSDVDQVDLVGGSELQSPPTLLLFDGRDMDEPVHMTSWLREISAVNDQSLDGFCRDSADESRHTEAAASLLFPKTLLDSLRRKNEDSPMPSLPSEGWDGFLLGAGHFKGSVLISDLRWYEKNLFARPEDPVIGLVVYSRAYDRNLDAGAATSAADTFLKEPSTLLVISAPQKSKVPSALDFVGTTEPKTDGPSLEQACLGHAWPACLGRHPRVLVVGPTAYPEEGAQPALANTGTYLLGSSTVRMAAPGANVPVLSRCYPKQPAAAGWTFVVDSGTSFSAPLVALVLSRLIQIGPQSLRNGLPEAAIWRLLATSYSFASGIPPAQSQTLTEFGRLDAGLALRGASVAEIGPNAASTLYEVDAEQHAVTTQAVIMPYPWNDQPANITSRTAGFVKLRTSPRNFITYAQPSENRVETIEFTRLLRLVRRPGDMINGSPAFDMFLVSEPRAGQPRSVIVRRRVRLGSGPYVESQGFCRGDALTVPDSLGANAQSQAQPACLYVWRASSDQFVPLDLAKVRDIVFPPHHDAAEFPRKISPADLRAVAAVDSPWKSAFCSTGPRLRTKEVLGRLNQPPWESVCTQ